VVKEIIFVFKKLSWFNLEYIKSTWNYIFKIIREKKLVLIYKQDGPKVFLLLEKVD
jgi:hypothetical protein